MKNIAKMFAELEKRFAAVERLTDYDHISQEPPEVLCRARTRLGSVEASFAV